MTGERAVAVETERRRVGAMREAVERPSHVFTNCVLWYARTIGTTEAPWLVRTESGETWLCERVDIVRGRTRLLSDEDRAKYPDTPRGVVACKNLLAYGARRLPV